MAQKVVELENNISAPSGNGNHVSEDRLPAAIIRKKRSRVPAYAVGGIILLGAIIGLFYWVYAQQFETTDDAFIDGNIVQISSKISAHVSKIHFTENQSVKKGDLLIELDSREIENKLELAQAQLKSALAQNEKALANVSLTRKTTSAGYKQASSNLTTAKNNVEQTKISADLKQNGIEQARNQVNTAEANLRQTQAEIPSAEAGVEQAKAQAVSAQTKLEIARSDVERAQQLFSAGDISKQGFDRSRKEFSEAQADLVSAQKQVDISASRLNSLRRQVEVAASRVNEAKTNVVTAENEYRQSVSQINSVSSQADESAGRLLEADSVPQQLAVTQSEVSAAEAQTAQAQAAVRQAELELSYTKIYAPSDGFITRKAVQEGQIVQSEQALVAISQSKSDAKSDLWVIANFKETQVGKLHQGQTVDIYVDAYPNIAFRGKVDSVQAGTGSRFSVFPAENATGNYVKVVQRIPVKIVFDDSSDKLNLLVPGMSVVPSVKIR
jgi:membrane fusion protein (multidrug efflux system)